MALSQVPKEKWGRNGDVWHLGRTVYVLEEEGGNVKVGLAEHPIRRLSLLQCGNPRLLTLRAVFVGAGTECRAIESSVLAHFSDKKLRGEWLSADADDVIAFVEGWGSQA